MRSGCRHCGASLEPQNTRCPNCGCFTDPSGRNVGIPRELSIERSAPDSFVASYRWWRWRRLSGWAPPLALIAADIAAIVLIRFVALGLHSYGALIPIGLLVVLPLTMFHIQAFQALFNRTHVRASPKEIHVSWGPLGGGERTIDVARVQQLFAAPAGRRSQTAAVHALLEGDEVVPLAKQLLPASASALERELEAFLSIVDRPVANELPRGEAFRAATRGGWQRPLLVAVVSVGLLGAGGWALSRPAIGGIFAEIPMSTKQASARFDLPQQQSVAVWVRMEVAYPLDSGLPTGQRTDVHDLPHLFDLALTFEQEGHSQSLACNPGRVENLLTSSRNTGFSEMSVGWFARVQHCSISLPAGSVKATAKLTPRQDAGVVRLEEATVVLRD